MWLIFKALLLTMFYIGNKFTPKKLLASFVSLVFEIKTVESAGYVGAGGFM